MLRLPDTIRRELDATGLPCRIETGGRLTKVYLGGAYIGSIRPGRSEGNQRATRNFISTIRRYVRETQGPRHA